MKKYLRLLLQEISYKFDYEWYYSTCDIRFNWISSADFNIILKSYCILAKCDYHLLEWTLRINFFDLSPVTTMWQRTLKRLIGVEVYYIIYSTLFNRFKNIKKIFFIKSYLISI